MRDEPPGNVDPASWKEVESDVAGVRAVEGEKEPHRRKRLGIARVGPFRNLRGLRGFPTLEKGLEPREPLAAQDTFLAHSRTVVFEKIAMKRMIARIAGREPAVATLARESKRPLGTGHEVALSEAGARAEDNARSGIVRLSTGERKKIVRREIVEPVAGGDEIVQEDDPLDAQAPRRRVLVEPPREIREAPAPVHDRSGHGKDGDPRRRPEPRLIEKGTDESLEALVVARRLFRTVENFVRARFRHADFEKGLRPTDVAGKDDRPGCRGTIPRHLSLHLSSGRADDRAVSLTDVPPGRHLQPGAGGRIVKRPAGGDPRVCAALHATRSERIVTIISERFALGPTPVIPLRLVLYNIRYGMGPGTSLTLTPTMPISPFSGVVGFLRELQPDVVALVEVDTGSMRSGSVNQALAIAESLGDHEAHYECKYAPNSITQRIPVARKQANAFVTRRQGSAARYHYFDKGVKRLVIELDLGLCSIFLVHLSLKYRHRQIQLRDLHALLEPGRKPVIVAGDFNTLHGPWELDLFAAATRLRSANVARLPTYPSRRPRKELDFVLVSEDIAVTACRVPEVPYSDHRPIVCDLLLPEETIVTRGGAHDLVQAEAPPIQDARAAPP